MPLTRDLPLLPKQSALLFIDVQNYTANRDSSAHKAMSAAEFEKSRRWFFQQLETKTIANMQEIQSACREAEVEVMYTVIESLTQNGRDRSLDYKITGFNVPKGSWDARVLDQIAPRDDEIVFPKTSSSPFVSTNIDYVLRNLGVKQLVVSGFLTDQCIESAVRDACDLGYLVTLVTDACQTYSKTRHANSLKTIKGYCRQVTTKELVNELRPPSGKNVVEDEDELDSVCVRGTR